MVEFEEYIVPFPVRIHARTLPRLAMFLQVFDEAGEEIKEVIFVDTYEGIAEKRSRNAKGEIQYYMWGDSPSEAEKTKRLHGKFTVKVRVPYDKIDEIKKLWEWNRTESGGNREG